MASTSDKTAVALADCSTENHSQSTVFQNDVHQASNTIHPFLQKALTSPVNNGEVPASLFPPISSSCHNFIMPQGSNVSWPILDAKARNNILLYTGSFNPPHQGHLATVLYFHERRVQLRITGMIVFADPASVVDGRKKKWADVILPQNLRHELFYQFLKLLNSLRLDGFSFSDAIWVLTSKFYVRRLTSFLKLDLMSSW